MSAYDDLIMALKAVNNARRIVVCEEAKKSEITALVRRHGMDHLWEVRPSPVCPEGKIIMIDRPAIEPGGPDTLF